MKKIINKIKNILGFKVFKYEVCIEHLEEQINIAKINGETTIIIEKKID